MKRTIDSYFKKGSSSVTEPSLDVDATCQTEPVSENDEAEKDSSGKAYAGKTIRTYEFRHQWLEEYQWLRYQDGAMHCVYCKFCGPSIAGLSKFVTASKQFKHESLKLHNESMKHAKCRDRYISRDAAALPTAFRRQDLANRASEESELIIKFNVAYNIAKEEMHFTKFKSQIILLKKNGVAINPTYANHKSCAEFIGVISDTLKQKTCAKISSFFCIFNTEKSIAAENLLLYYFMDYIYFIFP